MLSCDSSAHSSNWWSRLLKRLQRIYFHRQWPRKTVLVHSLTLKVTTFMEIILNGVFKLLRRYFVLTLCRITFVYPQLQGNQSWKGVNKWINLHVALFSSQYKSLLVTGCSWLVPGIRATLDTEIRRVMLSVMCWQCPWVLSLPRNDILLLFLRNDSGCMWRIERKEWGVEQNRKHRND
jgi:hypothetical protein